MTKQASIRLEEILKAVEGQRYPPVHKWNPDYCGDIDMVIKADGTWFYMGTPIGRKRMVKLFSTVLRKDEDGKTYLVTPVEKIGITVEDAHFTAITAEVTGEGQEHQTISFTTNVGDTVIMSDENQMWVVTADDGTPRPYLRVRDSLDALISRSVFYQLVDIAVEEDGKFGVWSGGSFFTIGDVP